MAVKYGKKRSRQNTVLYTVVTALLLSIVFLAMVGNFYSRAEDEAYEMLHTQTKQIKDDLTLQLLSDRENLVSMANFAAKLYADGESYDIMLDSFKPIGLIANIGILTPEGIFITREGELDLGQSISFLAEANRGAYISGRVPDLTNEKVELVRSAVPIRVEDQTVGILYGIVRLDGLDGKYDKMAKELDAQLYVYETLSGDYVIDTVRDQLGNVSELKDRKYTNGNSYEAMKQTDKGFTSFISAYSGEELYLHYSPIEELGWTIMLARPESEVFAAAHSIFRMLLFTFLLMALIIVCYLAVLMRDAKNHSEVTTCASKIRKLLLELNQQQGNINTALKEMASFSKARSAFFFNADGEDYNYAFPNYVKVLLTGEDRRYFIAQILRYAAELHQINNASLSLMRIIPNAHLEKTNPEFYDFLRNHQIREISFASVIDKNNRVGILGTMNPKKSRKVRLLLEEIAFCFSIAFYNKSHLNKTEQAATTDSLTGVLNRVAYKKDLLELDADKAEQFTCIYIDVNELHLRNNRYGHAAGDEMLLYIANSLKELFYRHRVYRMGGDEFLIFVQGVELETVKTKLDLFMGQLKLKDYHVAIGVSHRTQNTDTEEMVREAEVRMYEAKAEYYQNKEQSVSKSVSQNYVQIETGIQEIDAMLSILKDHYHGIYRVSLDTDRARRILMPAYLGYQEKEDHFTQLLKKYVDELVDADFHRPLRGFMNYDSLKRQLSEGKTPRITFKKVNGEVVILSVYRLDETDENVANTLWVFAKD
ncbi:MAG: GGDEF domain-containing protein [Clostridia bacterium]|nr:GGDEF domain-containing protein [Clostridia bacterium]